MSTTSAASLPPLAMRKTIEIPHTAPQLKLDSTAEEEGDITVLHLASDPSRDVFQIGRAANGGNDFMVRGAVHANKEGCAVGPVSRYACRIECERLPPFRAFIKAGGFDPITQVRQPTTSSRWLLSYIFDAGGCSTEDSDGARLRCATTR